MSSILNGFDSSQIAKDVQLLNLEDTYELGAVVPIEEAEKVINPKDKRLNKGEFVLVREPSAKGFIYAIFEGDDDGGAFYDTGDGILIETNKEDVFKIRDYRSFETDVKKTRDLVEKGKKKKIPKIKWSSHRKIRIITEHQGSDVFRDSRVNENRSAYKYLLKRHAFSRDPLKFLKIEIVDEIVKNHVFNDFLALKALRIRVLHNTELLEEFDKAIDCLEAIRRQYENEDNPKAKDLSLERYQTAATILQLFMHEVSRRGLEDGSVR